jgi:hypothetical protein
MCRRLLRSSNQPFHIPVLADPNANANIKAGDYYGLDLTQPPFNIGPTPLDTIKEGTADDKFMLLLDVSKMYWDEVMV